MTLLNRFVRSHDLGRVFSGPVDVLFGEGDYLAPDIVLVRKQRTAIWSSTGAQATAEPRVYGASERLEWTAVPSGPRLTVDLGELFGGG